MSKSMLSQFRLIIHYETKTEGSDSKVASAEMFEFSVEKTPAIAVDKTLESKNIFKSSNLPTIPTHERKSTTDAVMLHELNSWLSQQTLIGKIPNTAEQLNIFLVLNFTIHAFRCYEFYKAECAELARENLLDELKGQSVTTEKIFKLMQSCGVYNPRFSPNIGAQDLEKQIAANREKFLTKKEQTPSYNSFCFREDVRDKSTLVYFKKLGITPQTNFKTPADYLDQNYQDNVDEPLLHVRHCEHPMCSLNPDCSGFSKAVSDVIVNEVVKYVLTHYQANETIFYGGFASGLLLRDLTIIKELIAQGKNYQFQFFFLDTDYLSLIQQTTELYHSDLKFDAAIKINIMAKAFKEFGNWLATNLQKDVTIHVFSDIAEAERFFASQSQKLSVLVGEDFYCEKGALNPAHETQGAHADFMRLAKCGLDSKKGGFYELIKNEITGRIYLHHGMVAPNGYQPQYTHTYDYNQYSVTQYPQTSLGFFIGENDKAIKCQQGKDSTKIVSDQKGTGLVLQTGK